MLEILLFVGIGMLIGWRTTEPEFAKNITTYLVNAFNSFKKN